MAANGTSAGARAALMVSTEMPIRSAPAEKLAVAEKHIQGAGLNACRPAWSAASAQTRVANLACLGRDACFIVATRSANSRPAGRIDLVRVMVGRGRYGSVLTALGCHFRIDNPLAWQAPARHGGRASTDELHGKHNAFFKK